MEAIAATSEQALPRADAGGSPFAPYWRVGHVMALAILAVAIAEFLWNAHRPTDRDFISFWGAARLAIAGNPAGVYDLAALHSLQATVVTFVNGEHMPFPYPPAFLLLVMPFGLLSFPAAMAAWGAVTAVPFMLLVRRMFPQSGWLVAAFPPVFFNAAIGQNGFVTAALFIGAMLLLERRPFIAGLLLGCLIVKPQLGLLLPVALLAARQWRAIAGAAASAALVIAGGLLLFGSAASEAWLAQMPLYVTIGRDGLVGWHKMASVYAALRQAGLGAAPAFALHGIVAASGAVLVWRVWRSQAELRCKAAVLAAATLLASPYLFPYDAVLLVIAFLWLGQAGERVALVAALWFLPVLSMAQIAGGHGPLNFNALVPAALLLLIARRLPGSDAPSAFDPRRKLGAAPA